MGGTDLYKMKVKQCKKKIEKTDKQNSLKFECGAVYKEKQTKSTKNGADCLEDCVKDFLALELEKTEQNSIWRDRKDWLVWAFARKNDRRADGCLDSYEELMKRDDYGGEQ